jgi:hypothetical protein
MIRFSPLARREFYWQVLGERTDAFFVRRVAMWWMICTVRLTALIKERQRARIWPSGCSAKGGSLGC